MNPGEPIDYHVMEAMLDVERLDEIVAQVNAEDSWWFMNYERALQRGEVLASLMRLVKKGLVEVLLEVDDDADPFKSCGPGVWPNVPLAEMHFEVTGRGLVRLLNWIR
ncbi:MAG: hypothetical protein R2909_08365 [Gemmatimonadales bacterium]